MKFNLLGNSNIKVSEICLGSMNWGTQNSEAEVQGRTEEIIGSWFKTSATLAVVILMIAEAICAYRPPGA